MHLVVGRQEKGAPLMLWMTGWQEGLPG